MSNFSGNQSGQLTAVEASIAALGNTEKRVFNALSAGLNQIKAAEMAGCSESYVSQLMADDRFKSLLAEARAEKAQQYKKTDDLADKLQLQALERLEGVLKYETKVPVLLHAVKTLDGMKRRCTSNQQDEAVAATIVSIRLPAAAAAAYTVAVDLNNKVVEVGGETLLPATGRVIENMIKEQGDDTTEQKLPDGRAAAAYVSESHGTAASPSGYRPIQRSEAAGSRAAFEAAENAGR